MGIVVYLALMAFFSLRNNKTIANRKLFLLRAFFPCWKFFEDSGAIPKLYLRFGNTEQEFCKWIPAQSTIERRPWHLIFNPDGNLTLLKHSLLQQLLGDLQNVETGHELEFESERSYQLTKNWAEVIVKEYQSYR